jgi:ABC-type phosphate/phosphonate transport system ATPase subunit
MADQAAIELVNIGLRFSGRELVKGLSHQINKGEFVAVAGPSGSGKTTLLHAMAGFMAPQQGEVRRSVRARNGIGFVYQHLRLALPLTALTAVCTGKLHDFSAWQTLFGFSKATRQSAYEELVQLGLRDSAHQPIGRLSGGERQRVAVARSFFQEPDIYLMDEPVANLDRTNAQLVLARLRREVTERGRTVVVVLHDETQIGLFADRVLRWDRSAPSLWREETLRAGGRS